MTVLARKEMNQINYVLAIHEDGGYIIGTEKCVENIKHSSGKTKDKLSQELKEVCEEKMKEIELIEYFLKTLETV